MMLKKLLIIAAIYYVYRQSQTSGTDIVTQAKNDITSLLSQLQLENPPVSLPGMQAPVAGAGYRVVGGWRYNPPVH